MDFASSSGTLISPLIKAVYEPHPLQDLFISPDNLTLTSATTATMIEEDPEAVFRHSSYRHRSTGLGIQGCTCTRLPPWPTGVKSKDTRWIADAM